MKAWIRNEFERLVSRTGGRDFRWIETLDECDEPPLFTRHHEIEFLRGVPLQERSLAIMEFSLEELERIVDFLAARPKKQPVFACLTLMDWDEYRSGSELVVTPRFLISPNPRVELRRFRLGVARSPEATEAASWLRRLRQRRFVLGESDEPDPPELQRVYVGHRRRRATHVLTVADYIRAKRASARA